MTEATAASIAPETEPAAVEEVRQEMEALQGPGQGQEDKKKSKKDLKKEAKAAEKAAKAAAHTQAEAAKEAVDPLGHKYGDLPLIQSQQQTGRVWTDIGDLADGLEGQTVLIQGQIYTARAKGNSAFLVLREGQSTVQVLAFKTEGKISKQMVKFMADVPKESWVEVSGEVQAPRDQSGNRVPITGTSQQVEIAVDEFRVMSRAEYTPFDIADAARNEDEAAKTPPLLSAGGLQTGLPTVKQDTRLDTRYLDLRTPANQAIFAVQAGVCQLFREVLLRDGFQEIHTPKLIAGSSEGGANVFKLQYFGRDACLAQSPQLYKQMAIMGGIKRVFEIGPVFRAENSHTHRHLCEFTGLDFEMAVHEHYFEVLDVIERLFFHIFEGLNERYGSMLEIIREQYPFEPLVWKPLRISFAEGIALLRENGIELGEYDDLNTEAERRLGALVRKKYGTDFFIMYRYPLEIRPFYTMPDPTDETYSNSYDVFIRGEEIISGAQRVHDPLLLLKMAERCGISMAQEGVKDYVDSFRYGARPHGGAGVGMERVVMLFLGLDNIRKTSMFPRDPRRLTP